MSLSRFKGLSATLLCILCLPGLSPQSPPISSAAVQGLLGFKARVNDPQGVLASWNSSSTPCSTPDCNNNRTAAVCNWANIVCQAGQVIALAVPCTVLSNGATGPCALQGAPLDPLAQVTTLRLLDLSGNALQGTLPAAFGSALQNLVVLLLGSNLLTGTLPTSWSNLPNLQVADMGDNRLYGQLPPSWGALPKVKGLRLAANHLTGRLPSSYGNWTSIQELELGGNGLYGTVPSSWGQMAALQDLELDYNCGLCGNLPTFPMQASAQLSVALGHTSISKGCSDSNCSGSNLALILRTVIGVLVICAVLMVVGLRSWQLRRRRRLGLGVQYTWEFRLQNWCRRRLGMSPLVAPVSSIHQRARDTELAGGLSRRSRRIKTQQPTLVIMPDGHSLCFALKESPPVIGQPASRRSKPDERHEAALDPNIGTDDDAAMSSQQQAIRPHHPDSTRIQERSIESLHQPPTNGLQATLPGSTMAASS